MGRNRHLLLGLHWCMCGRTEEADRSLSEQQSVGRDAFRTEVRRTAVVTARLEASDSRFLW